jgi:AFG3 family protein
MRSNKDQRDLNPGNTPPPAPGKPSYVSWISMILVVLLGVFLIYRQRPTAEREISWQEFEQTLLSKHRVERLEVINKEVVHVYLKQEPELTPAPQLKDPFAPSTGERPQYQFTIGSVESFDRRMDEAQQRFAAHEKVPVRYVQRNSGWLDSLGWLLPLLLLIFVWQFLFRRMTGAGGNPLLNYGKSTATLFEKDNKSRFRFSDVAGLEEAKVEVKEIVDFLKTPEAYTHLGAKIPRGVLLVGPPGTGKTLLAKAVAGEAQVPFFSISGSAFVEMYVGVGASRVRDLFKQAKEKAPCIVFIDEIDAIGRTRGPNAQISGANDERESTLNQLLTEMDGFETNTGIIVLAATNRADMLDRALLRPGRFDRHIYLELPNLTERKAVFQVHLKPLALDPSVEVACLAAQTPGFSGADIANICNEAALIAARRKKKRVDKADFMDAIDRIIAGLEKKSKIISPEEKQIIAGHEAGHALASWLLPHVDPLVKVSIVPRGKSLGAAWYLPEERQLRTRAAFVDSLTAMLAGRAAEEILFGEVSSGALDDLEKVTQEAYTMVAYYGFNSRLGNVSFYDSAKTQQTAFQKPYSEETGSMIDSEVRKLVAEAYGRASQLLTERKGALLQIAGLLMQKEIIFREDMEKILGKRPVGRISDAILPDWQPESAGTVAFPIPVADSET